MLETFTLETFTPYVTDMFRIFRSSIDSLDVELITATDLSRGREHLAPQHPRSAFSLVFRVPGGTHLLQQIYRMEHSIIGAFDLFLVPIGPDTKGMCYEAIFN